jgi:hypothetical protein
MDDKLGRTNSSDQTAAPLYDFFSYLACNYYPTSQSFHWLLWAHENLTQLELLEFHQWGGMSMQF